MCSSREDTEQGPDSRRVVAPRAEHDGRVRQAEPVPVVPPQVPHQLAHVFISLARHHEPDREAGRVRRGGHELEAPQRAKGALALEVHVQDDACTKPVSKLHS